MRKIIKYQKCFIAYLDILGFGERVKHSENNQEEIKLLLDSLKICNTFTRGNKKVTNNMGEARVVSIQSRFFSDSVVFFLKESPIDIGHLFLIIRYVQDKLWENELLIRGAIAYGDMYFPTENKEENITLGPGIIKAHYLESEITVYPRILVSEELCDYIQRKDVQADPFAYDGKLIDYIRQDNDGVRFLDLLNKDVVRAEGEKLKKDRGMFSIVWKLSAGSRYDYIISCVEKCIENRINSDKEKIQQKGKWLKFYKESALKGHKCNILGPPYS
jgi:hypothetical protein